MRHWREREHGDCERLEPRVYRNQGARQVSKEAEHEVAECKEERPWSMDYGHSWHARTQQHLWTGLWTVN